MNPIVNGFQQLFESTDDRNQWNRLASILQLERDHVRGLSNDRSLSYQCYKIKKRSGGKRSISAPNGKLKQLQRRLYKRYLNDLPVHYSSHAFQSVVSIKSHALTHAGMQLIVTCDVKDFFAATGTRRVRKFFQELGWSGEPLRALVRLTTFRGGLPQGAPTSPVLSNLVNYQLDQRLEDLATNHIARYSRYCDDLAFSFAMNQVPDTFQSSVAGILDSFGYQMQMEKGWCVQHSQDIPEITGIAIHGRQLTPSRALHKKRERLRQAAASQPELTSKLIGLQAFWKFLRR